MVRSLVSKIVPNEEVGKVFALIVVSEALFGMAGSPTFTAIYNATISTNPAIFNFVAAGIYGVEILLAMYVVLFLSGWVLIFGGFRMTICVYRVSRNEVVYQEIVDKDDSCSQSVVEDIVS